MRKKLLEEINILEHNLEDHGLGNCVAYAEHDKKVEQLKRERDTFQKKAKSSAQRGNRLQALYKEAEKHHDELVLKYNDLKKVAYDL